MRVKYVGPKSFIDVSLPVGEKNQRAVYGSARFVGDEVKDLKRKDAMLLCALDVNFVIADEIAEKELRDFFDRKEIRAKLELHGKPSPYSEESPEEDKRSSGGQPSKSSSAK